MSEKIFELAEKYGDWDDFGRWTFKDDDRLLAFVDAIAEAEKQEQKTPLKVLSLTVFTENRLRNGRVYDVETLQAMTNRDILAIPDMGKKALKEVLEALDAYAINMSQERVDETAKREHDEDWYGQWQWQCGYERGWDKGYEAGWDNRGEEEKNNWIGLTDEEVGTLTVFDGLTHIEVPILADFVRAIEAKLKEKNGG